MKVSIVTVVFDSEEFIETCIRSVLSQDYKDIEYIVIDGLSTDGTPQIIQRYQHRLDAYLSEEDGGVYEAINKGISIANGDIIGILNADDVFADANVVSSIVNCFLHQSCDAVYGNLCMVRRHSPEKVLRNWRSRQYRRTDLKLGWMPAHPAFYIRRSILCKNQLYRPEFGVSADYELILRLLYNCQIRAVFLRQTLVVMRAGGLSNGSILKAVHTLVHDIKALKENKIPYPIIVALIKKIRKVVQYIS